MNAESTGSGRRQNYQFEPTSRMSNTYIDKGPYTPEEIIQSVNLVFTQSHLAAAVNPATGDFNFSCDEAYIIRDGKICELVKGAALIGTGAEVLMKIDMVANDLARAQGMCGAKAAQFRLTLVNQQFALVKLLSVEVEEHSYERKEIFCAC